MVNIRRASLRSVSMVAAVCLFFCSLTVFGEDYNGGVSATVLKRTLVTGNGQKIVYPVTDKAEVTAMKVDIPAGSETGWHRHPVPVYAYVLSGTLDVELEDGQVMTFRGGDAIIEVVDTLHNGRNRGSGTVRLAVFYTGVEGKPNVVKPVLSAPGNRRPAQ